MSIPDFTYIVFILVFAYLLYIDYSYCSNKRFTILIYLIENWMSYKLTQDRSSSFQLIS